MLAARSKDKLDALSGEINRQYGVQAYALACDLSKADASRQLAEQISKLGFTRHKRAQRSHVDDDSVPTPQHIGQKTMRKIDKRSRVQHNLFLLALQVYFLETAVSTEACVVDKNIDRAYTAVYGATKAFVLSFSEALWAETRGRGIRVLALCPGVTDTGFFDAVGSKDMAAGRKFTTPEKVVQAGFRGIDQRRSYILDRRTDYFIVRMLRFFSRRRVALIMERMSNPKRHL